MIKNDVNNIATNHWHWCVIVKFQMNKYKGQGPHLATWGKGGKAPAAVDGQSTIALRHQSFNILNINFAVIH